MPRELCLQYAAELDERAAAGDIRARDYAAVCWGEFEARLEECMIALQRQRLEAPVAASPRARSDASPTAQQSLF